MDQAKGDASGTSAKSEAPRALADSGRFRWNSPIVLSLAGVLLTGLGTGLGAFLTGYWNSRLEAQKFEFSLIQRALENATPNGAAKTLNFLVSIGALSNLDENEILRRSENPGDLPVFLGAALRDELTTVSQVKVFLKNFGLYHKEINDEAGPDFRVAIMDFQRIKKLDVDGLLGPKTFLAMWRHCDECPDLLRKDSSKNSP